MTKSSMMDGIKLICGDVLSSLKGLPNSIADLVVTSPPYNIGKEYETRRSLHDYLQWCHEWMNEVHRVTSPSGSFWLNLGYLEVPAKGRAVPLPYLLWDKSPFYFLQEIVWNYGAGVASRRSFSPRNEKWLWLVKDADSYFFDLDSVRDPDVKYPNQKKNGKLKCNPLGKNPGDVWAIPKVTSGTGRASPERAPHPAQFPLAVVERIIRSCSQEGQLVLDPFCGSGSTMVACALNGRRAIGIEIRADYCAIAQRRLQKAQAKQLELELFT